MIPRRRVARYHVAIYVGQSSGPPYLSNRRRARLMKGTFVDELSIAAEADKAFRKVLLKLGAWHMYRGLNPLHSSELGHREPGRAACRHRARHGPGG